MFFTINFNGLAMPTSSHFINTDGRRGEAHSADMATKGSVTVSVTEALVFLQNYYNVPTSQLFDNLFSEFKQHLLLQRENDVTDMEDVCILEQEQYEKVQEHQNHKRSRFPYHAFYHNII